jgi:hypothetical protein
MDLIKPIDYKSIVNADLSTIDWDRVLLLFVKINWKHRLVNEIEKAFRISTHTITFITMI